MVKISNKTFFWGCVCLISFLVSLLTGKDTNIYPFTICFSIHFLSGLFFLLGCIKGLEKHCSNHDC